MKRIIIISLFGLLAISCKKVVSNGSSETITFGENTMYTLNPANGSLTKKIILTQTDFVSSVRGKIETEQEALGRDIYDFEIRSVEFNAARTNTTPNTNDPLDNYLNGINVFFDKNDGSQPIKIANAETVNSDMNILESNLLGLTSKYPNYEIYYTAVFDQVPNDIINATIEANFSVSTNYKFKEKK